ncbi:DNA (cytosine-5)-methyltransferase DRM2-like [Rutidosis leptorrhynchoides]|uniref:DNA (cytosine-5)-methyltransferase DRM2-like n=1 Tax=Rutidosis leptorrhynchoides TaxID=125765 RepID=UPI003A99ECAE
MSSDLGEFQIPCLICGPISVIGLADTGSSINVMPFSVYNRLRLPSLEPIQGSVCFADSRLHKPLGVVNQVEVIVGYAFYRFDFVIMDMKEDLITPLILGSSFLATARATINYDDNSLIIRCGAIFESIPLVPRSKVPRSNVKMVKIDKEDDDEFTVDKIVTEFIKEQYKLSSEDDNFSDDGSISIDWSTDDELGSPSSSVPLSTNGALNFEFGESSSSSKGPTKVVLHYMEMGFSEALVTKVIQELGESDADAIVDTLLTYSAVGDIPQPEIEPNDPNLLPQIDIDSDFSDFDSDLSDNEDKDDPLVSLIDMGYSPEEAETAISRCGKDTPLSELVDFVSAAHLSKEADIEMDILSFENGLESHSHSKDKKRKLQKGKFQSKNKKIVRKRKDEDDDVLHLPNPMIGFGVPNQPHFVRRKIPAAAQGPPYFFYENVALTPKGVWNTIQSFLYEIEPEFVDSKFFCAAARKRGYIHNLPLEDRFPIQPIPPKTIFEALPGTKQWWPSWDKREQLNCILTCVGSAQLSERIKLRVENCVGEPNSNAKKFVNGQCRKWNMVWTGKNRVAPLEPDEIEQIMGYPTYHTRGASRVERYRGLGNAFQVDTVAYQLSVLKNLYPDGINVLSLFSGIGGAEVALHRLGIKMKNVVSVEKSSVCQNIIQGWWEQTNQTGNLIHVSDVQDVTRDQLAQWIGAFGGFDLVIGGSPCNNLAGGNRRTRDGLQGQHSSLFYDYVRILDAVKSLMGRD